VGLSPGSECKYFWDEEKNGVNGMGKRKITRSTESVVKGGMNGSAENILSHSHGSKFV